MMIDNVPFMGPIMALQSGRRAIYAQTCDVDAREIHGRSGGGGSAYAGAYENFATRL